MQTHAKVEQPTQVYVAFAHSSHEGRVPQGGHAVSRARQKQEVFCSALHEDAYGVIIVIELGHREICFALE
eukprot:161405-Pleurochrysis_carterae.AAC.1